MNHKWKVSCHGWLDPQGQGHDREGNGTSTLWCHAADGGAEDHGDGEEVAVGEVGEKIVLYGKAPPVKSVVVKVEI